MTSRENADSLNRDHDPRCCLGDHDGPCRTHDELAVIPWLIETEPDRWTITDRD